MIVGSSFPRHSCRGGGAFAAGPGASASDGRLGRRLTFLGGGGRKPCTAAAPAPLALALRAAAKELRRPWPPWAAICCSGWVGGRPVGAAVPAPLAPALHVRAGVARRELLSVMLLGERQPIRHGSWGRHYCHGRREAKQKMRGRRDLRPHAGRVPSDGQTIRSPYHQHKLMRLLMNTNN